MLSPGQRAAWDLACDGQRVRRTNFKSRPRPRGKLLTSDSCHASREKGDVEKIPKPVALATAMQLRSLLKETEDIGLSMHRTFILARIRTPRCSERALHPTLRYSIRGEDQPTLAVQQPPKTRKHFFFSFDFRSCFRALSERLVNFANFPVSKPASATSHKEEGTSGSCRRGDERLMRIENRLAYSKPILLLALLLFSQVQVQSWSNAARISPVGSRGSTSTSAMLRFATFRIARPAAAPGQRIIAASLRCAVRQASMSLSSSVTPSEESQTRNSDPSAAAVVVGGGRGIGLAMAKNLCSRFAGRIYVTARNPQKSPGLQELIDAQDLQPVGQGSHDAPTHQQSLAHRLILTVLVLVLGAGRRAEDSRHGDGRYAGEQRGGLCPIPPF